MNDLFEHAKSNWVRYSKYEIKEKNGVSYTVPAEDAMTAVPTGVAQSIPL